MGYLIGWGIFAIGLIAAFVIVGRKFSLLANIDVDEIQTEKNNQLKQQIIANQLKRRFSHWGLFFARLIKPVSRFLRNSFDWIYDRLNAWQRSQAHKDALIGEEIGKRIEVLLAEAEALVKDERFDAAEKKYIEIIGLDSHNFTAFRELGEVYLRNQSLNEARQTFEHALELKKKSAPADKESAPDLEAAHTHYLLAQVHEEAGDLNKAMIQLKRALKIEENSPRYLDRLIEVSIMKKDKIAALDAYKKLETVNPENQKLVAFKQRIQEL